MFNERRDVALVPATLPRPAHAPPINSIAKLAPTLPESGPDSSSRVVSSVAQLPALPAPSLNSSADYIVVRVKDDAEFETFMSAWAKETRYAWQLSVPNEETRDKTKVSPPRRFLIFLLIYLQDELQQELATMNRSQPIQGLLVAWDPSVIFFVVLKGLKVLTHPTLNFTSLFPHYFVELRPESSVENSVRNTIKSESGGREGATPIPSISALTFPDLLSG